MWVVVDRSPHVPVVVVRRVDGTVRLPIDLRRRPAQPQRALVLADLSAVGEDLPETAPKNSPTPRAPTPPAESSSATTAATTPPASTSTSRQAPSGPPPAERKDP